MNNIEENIDALAAAKSHNIPGKWRFTPVLPLIVDDLNTNSYIGELQYQNAGYEFGPAIQIRNWVFCLERMNALGRQYVENTTPPHVWILAAFHGANHYSFYGINPDPNTTEAATRIQFVTDVATTFWPMFYPEHVFKGSIVVPQLSEDESKILQAKILIGGKQ